MSAPVVNISAYKFVALKDLPLLREELRQRCTELSLKGTILLSAEGINLFVAGQRSAITELIATLHAHAEFADLEAKESLSREQPFNRMLVKIKREIIAFGVETVDPIQHTSPRISPVELKNWFDQGRTFALLDTRNNYEVEAGTFCGATAIDIDDFRHFPHAVQQLPDAWKNQPVVTFCTGGIRCEKAAPLLEQAGFSEVYQLDGGILKYFEQCGGDHYQGTCFVFDKRVAVDPNLHETNLRICFACQAILSTEEQVSPEYVEGQSCPHCYQPPAELKRQLLASRHEVLKKTTTPLPGSNPYDNIRPLSIPQRYDGFELLECLRAMQTHYSTEQWQAACAAGEVTCNGEAIQPGCTMRGGDRLLHKMPATREPHVNSDIQIIDEDEAIIVINKPAPLPMHPCGRFNRNTLQYIVAQVYAPQAPRTVHRLDADTTGVVVLAKTRQFTRLLQEQFRNREVQKSYLTRVHGHPSAQEFTCNASLSDQPGPCGARLPDKDGPASSTQFRELSFCSDSNTTLLEAIPLTGRTNQIRAHLWHLGIPIVGDPIYRIDGNLGESHTLSIDDPPLCLHAATIEFIHPLTQQPVRFEADCPQWVTAPATSR